MMAKRKWKKKSKISNNRSLMYKFRPKFRPRLKIKLKLRYNN